MNEKYFKGLDTVSDTIIESSKSADLVSTAFGLESLENIDSTASEGTTDVNRIASGIKDVLDANSVDSKMTYDNVQSMAAIGAGLLALDPGRTFVDEQLNPDTVMPDAFGIDAISNNEFGLESFDGQDLKNIVKYSVTVNLLSSKQDAFSEAFFRTRLLPPGKKVVELSSKVLSLAAKYTRNKTGVPVKEKKITLAKAAGNSKLLESSLNRIYPLADADDKLVNPDLKEGKEINGQIVDVAPIRFNAEVDIAGASQRLSDLSKGSTTNSTDALDRRQAVEYIYIKVGSSYIKKNVAGTHGAAFHYTPDGDSKNESTANMTKAKLVINSKEKDIAGAEIASLAALGENIDIIVTYTAIGNSDAETCIVSLGGNEKLKIDKVVNTSSKMILAETDSTYTDAAAVVDAMKLDSWMPEMYLTNSNHRMLGQIFKANSVSRLYAVPRRLGSVILTPRTNRDEGLNDAELINQHHFITDMYSRADAIDTLLAHRETLKALTSSSSALIGNVYTETISKDYIDPHYREIEINVSEIMDSVKSNEKGKDISGAISLVVRDAVVKMISESNYGEINRLYNANGEIELVVGGNETSTQWLNPGDLIIEDSKTVSPLIVNSKDTKLADELYVTVRSKNVPSTSALSALLDYGTRHFAPSLVVDTNVNVDGAEVKASVISPQYLHVPNLPVLLVFKLTGIEKSILSKTVVKTNAV